MLLIPLNDCSSYKEINTNNETGKERCSKTLWLFTQGNN